MVSKVKQDDRRVQRTHRLLYEGLAQLLQQKSFEALTVRDIAEQAMVNRGTFYLHFSDKYALLNDYIRYEFQQILSSHFSPSHSLNEENLRLLTLTTMRYLAQVYEHCRPSDKAVASVLETALQQELDQVVLHWLKHSPLLKSRATTETVATTISWAILGVSTSWRQNASGTSAEDQAQQVVALLFNGLSPLTPSNSR